MTEPKAPEPSCLDDTEPDFISMEDARETIFAAAPPRGRHHYVPLADALNRVLARDFLATLDVPRRDNSAMDGWAVNTQGQGAPANSRFREIGVALAGQPFEGQVGPGEAVRITTGAWVPAGADTIVIHERAGFADGTVTSFDAAEPGQNLRRAGEDVRAGEVLIAAGTRLMPAHLGLLGSVGTSEVLVTRPPRVAYFSTGNEVRTAGESLEAGAIFDSNRHTVAAMLRRLGIEVLDLGVVVDEPEAMRRAFGQAREAADVIITSGGVSVGEADFIKPTLRGLGEARFWKVAVRPGRPFTFGLLGETLFFGLPGNPVAVMVMFYGLVQPSLRHLAGEPYRAPVQVSAVCRSRLRKRPGRTEYQRGILSRTADGGLEVEKTGMQGSGILSSMAAADCFIVLEEDDATVEPGQRVTVQPFFGLV